MQERSHTSCRQLLSIRYRQTSFCSSLVPTSARWGSSFRQTRPWTTAGSGSRTTPVWSGCSAFHTGAWGSSSFPQHLLLRELLLQQLPPCQKAKMWTKLSLKPGKRWGALMHLEQQMDSCVLNSPSKTCVVRVAACSGRDPNLAGAATPVGQEAIPGYCWRGDYGRHPIPCRKRAESAVHSSLTLSFAVDLLCAVMYGLQLVI